MGGSIHGVTPINGWFRLENLIKMDEGVLLFQETSSHIHIYINTYILYISEDIP
jgi:hypothetical protein